MIITSCSFHCGSSLPACTATIYSAYQSGQFSSRWPVRFSCWPWAASARLSALARSFAEANAVSARSTRPGSRVVTSCNSHPLPSGSLNVAKELIERGPADATARAVRLELSARRTGVEYRR